LYLCFIDESGTHGGSPVLVVGGIAIREEDAWHLQQRLGLPRGSCGPSRVGGSTDSA